MENWLQLDCDNGNKTDLIMIKFVTLPVAVPFLFLYPGDYWYTSLLDCVNFAAVENTWLFDIIL